MTPWTAASLAGWALDLDTGDLPDAVIAKAIFGEGDAVVWFETERLHPTGAAFANAESASMLDIDDGQPIRLWRDQGRNRPLTHGPDEFGRSR